MVSFSHNEVQTKICRYKKTKNKTLFLIKNLRSL